MNYVPQVWHDLPTTDTPISAARLGVIEAGIAASVSRGELVLNVRDYGALGDGFTNDTAAIQSALTVASGKTVFVPAGTYMVNANADTTNHIGLKMTQPGTRLLLDPGAVLKVITNNLTNYVLISVTAADCRIEGGTYQGDVTTHTGSTGEWGHLIVIDAGADRCAVQNVTVREAWGDGFIIQRGPADVSVTNINSDSNRRQGMSITGALRPRVNGGVVQNTGLLGVTAPAAGIDVEPNPSSGYDVIDCVISNVVSYNNAGPGFLTFTATGQTTDVQIDNCRADSNGTGVAGFPYSGFRAGGTAGTGRTIFTNCVAVGNFLHGFDLATANIGSTSCRARGNVQNGFEVTGASAELVNPVSKENGRHGIHLAATAGASQLIGGSTSANSQTTTNTYSNVSFDAVGLMRVLGHNSYAGALTNAPKYGYEINTGAGVRMYGCDVSGTFGTANFLNTPGATMIPVPGVSRAAAITAPNTQTASYVQADVASLKTAIDALRVAVQSAGITA